MASITRRRYSEAPRRGHERFAPGATGRWARLCQDAAMSAALLTGQAAVVTGASRGLGKAIAVHLARQGAATAGIARAAPDLAALSREADGAAGRLLAYPADVTSAGKVAAAFARVDADCTPQLVVACAGTADVLGRLWLADPQQWWQAVAVDLRGTTLTAQCAISRTPARLRRQGRHDLRQPRRPATGLRLGIRRRQGRHCLAHLVAGRRACRRPRFACPGCIRGSAHRYDRAAGLATAAPGLAARLRRNGRETVD